MVRFDRGNSNWYLENNLIENCDLYKILKANDWMLVLLENNENEIACFPLSSIHSNEKLTIKVDL